MKVKTSILLLLMIATALPSFGGNGNGNGTDSLQATRYVTRATMYGVGYTNVFDTTFLRRNTRESSSASAVRPCV